MGLRKQWRTVKSLEQLNEAIRRSHIGVVHGRYDVLEHFAEDMEPGEPYDPTDIQSRTIEGTYMGAVLGDKTSPVEFVPGDYHDSSDTVTVREADPNFPVGAIQVFTRRALPPAEV